MKMLQSLLALAVLALVLAPLAFAQTMEGSGHAVYVTQSAKKSPMPDGRMLVNNHVSGVLIADDTSSPFHLATHDCTGAYVAAAEGGPPQAQGSSCAAIDADGDIWWLAFTNLDGEGGGEWHILGGTGKFEGMEGSGTTDLLSASPDGRTTIRWTGSWTMK